MAVTTDLTPSSRSVLITFTVRVIKRHPVNNLIFLNNLVQRMLEPQSNQNKTSVPVFYRRIK